MIKQRLKAFLLDYLIILGYILALLGTTVLLSGVFNFPLQNTNPFAAEIIGFLTLTLPVMLYFTLLENGADAGTFGKQKLKLRVVHENLSRATLPQLLLRNGIKFFPWELAHFSVFQLFYFLDLGATPPAWVMTGLIFSQGLAIGFLWRMVSSKSGRSVYEVLSRTKVV